MSRNCRPLTLPPNSLHVSTTPQPQSYCDIALLQQCRLLVPLVVYDGTTVHSFVLLVNSCHWRRGKVRWAASPGSRWACTCKVRTSGRFMLSLFIYLCDEHLPLPHPILDSCWFNMLTVKGGYYFFWSIFLVTSCRLAYRIKRSELWTNPHHCSWTWQTILVKEYKGRIQFGAP